MFFSRKTPDFYREQALNDFYKSPNNHYSAFKKLTDLAENNIENPAFIASVRRVSNKSLLDIEISTSNDFKATVLANAVTLGEKFYNNNPGVRDYMINILGLGLAHPDTEIRKTALNKTTSLSRRVCDLAVRSDIDGLLIHSYRAFDDKKDKEKIIETVFRNHLADCYLNARSLKNSRFDPDEPSLVIDFCKTIIETDKENPDKSLTGKALKGLFYLIGNIPYNHKTTEDVAGILKTTDYELKDAVFAGGFTGIACRNPKAATHLLKSYRNHLDINNIYVDDRTAFVRELNYHALENPNDKKLKTICREINDKAFAIASENSDEELLSAISVNPDFTEKAFKLAAEIPFISSATGEEFDSSINRLSNFIDEHREICEEKGITTVSEFIENYAIIHMAQNPLAAKIIRYFDKPKR